LDEQSSVLPADQHRHHDWRPAKVEHVVGILVLLGNPHPQWRYEDIASYDEGCHPVLLVYTLVQYGGDPRKERERRDVAEASSYRRGHVVRIDVATTREDDDGCGDETQNEGSEGRGDQTAGAQKIRVVQGDCAVAEGAHHDRHYGPQEAHHYRLTLRQIVMTV